MASRPLMGPFLVIDDGDMSGDIISLPTIIQNISMLSYDISWAGTAPVGVMSIQVSNSYSQNADGTIRDGGNWTTVPLSSVPTVSGNTGNGFIDVDALGAYAVRLVYTRTSGTGLMTAIVTAKVA